VIFIFQGNSTILSNFIKIGQDHSGASSYESLHFILPFFFSFPSIYWLVLIDWRTGQSCNITPFECALFHWSFHLFIIWVAVPSDDIFDKNANYYVGSLLKNSLYYFLYLAEKATDVKFFVWLILPLVLLTGSKCINQLY